VTLRYFLWHLIRALLLRNRLPTRDNLVRRHIITPDSPALCDWLWGVETTHHLFLSFPVFASLWHLVRGWVGTSTTDPYWLQDHFVQFVYSAEGTRARRSFM
jgi:hypothetical protein